MDFPDQSQMIASSKTCRQIIYNQNQQKQNFFIKTKINEEIKRKKLLKNDQNIQKFVNQRFLTTYNQRFNQLSCRSQNDRMFFKKEIFTKFIVSYTPKDYDRVKYQTLVQDKSNQIYNCTQPMKVKTQEVIQFYDENYFKGNKVDKTIKQLNQSNKKHFKFILPQSAFQIKQVQSQKYSFK